MIKKVSIIVPVYNTDKHLRKCIDSLINQIYKEIEIILINDGSTDKSGEICEYYAEIDTRIKTIHKINGGVSSARNAGLAESTGDYIVFVDSDDWIENNAINDLVKIQKKHNYDIIMYGYYRDNIVNGKITSRKFVSKSYDEKEKIKDVIPKLIVDESINSLWTKMYKAEVIRDNKIQFDETLSIGEDALFNYQVFFKVNTFYISDEKYYHYIIGELGTLTTTYNPHKYEMLTNVNKKLNSIIEQNSHSETMLKSAAHIRTKNIYSSFLDFFSKNNDISKNNKKKYIKKVLYNEAKENDTQDTYSNNKLYQVLAKIITTGNIDFIYITIFIIYKTRTILNKIESYLN